MLTIALTSIPPRFPQLGEATECLLAQTQAARVVVSIPIKYRRFPDLFDIPHLPDGVIVRRPSKDFGPATKLLGCLDDPEAADILYCDDDWDYGPGWARALVAARQSKMQVSAASSFAIDRLKRNGEVPFDRVAQGFGGVLVHKSMFDRRVFNLPPAAYASDDIWLSGHLAANRIQIVEVSQAQKECAPRAVPGRQLQASVVDGMSRAEANAACADAVTERFGVWPKRSVPYQ